MSNSRRAKFWWTTGIVAITFVLVYIGLYRVPSLRGEERHLPQADDFESGHTRGESGGSSRRLARRKSGTAQDDFSRAESLATGFSFSVSPTMGHSHRKTNSNPPRRKRTRLV